MGVCVRARACVCANVCVCVCVRARHEQRADAPIAVTAMNLNSCSRATKAAMSASVAGIVKSDTTVVAPAQGSTESEDISLVACVRSRACVSVS